MSQPSPEDILEMARRDIAARNSAVIEQRVQRDLPWRYAFWGLLGALLIGLLFWPGMSLDEKMFMVGHGICAQLHTVQLGGLTLPICARNTGIYGSFLITFVYLLALGRGRAMGLPPAPISIALLLLVVVMGFDGFNSLFLDLGWPHLYTPRNELRTLTGIGMGVAMGVLILLILNLSLRRNGDDALPVMRNWAELFGALLLSGLMLVVMYGNLPMLGWMYWPIAIMSTVGIVGVLFCVNLLIAGMILGYENKVVRWSQLMKPATFAVIFTLVEVGTLAGLRLWLEMQGLVV